MTPIRFGILGFGRFAERAIAPAIRASRGAALVAVQKRSRDEAREAARRAEAPLFFDSADALARCPEVDAVFIVSANSTHAPEALEAARHGKHVLVEKPMALDAAEAERMIAACRAAGVRLSVGHMVRLSPLVRRVKALVDSGALGAVTFAGSEFVYDARLSQRAWLTDRAVAGGGPVFDVGVHCLDTLRYVLGDEPVSLAAQLAPLPTAARTERTGLLALRFARGTPASIFCSYDSPVRRSVLEVRGTEATVVAHDFTRGDARLRLEIGVKSDGERLDTHIEEIDVPSLYVEEVERFVEAVRGGGPLELSGENGLLNQRWIDAAMVPAAT